MRVFEERASGLGREFVETVDEILASITKNPLAFPVVRNIIRRGLTKRFPYGVFFVLAEETVVVLAVLHQSRDPELWARRA
jgi:plasmid stabilization system protein ParE